MKVNVSKESMAFSQNGRGWRRVDGEEGCTSGKRNIGRIECKELNEGTVVIRVMEFQESLPSEPDIVIFMLFYI